MKKVLAGVLLGSVFSSSAIAGSMTGGVLLSQFKADDLSLNTLSGSFGYQFDVNERFSVTPELRLGFGIGTDNDQEEVDGNFYDIENKISNFNSLGVKFEYMATEKAYLLFDVISLKLKFADTEHVINKTSFTGTGVTSSTTVIKSGGTSNREMGFGFGAGYNVSERASIEARYEKVKELKVLSAGLKFKF